MGRLYLVCTMFALLAACSAETTRRAPGQVEGLGSASPDCVAACTAFFADCREIVVFVDGSGVYLAPAECARNCADEAEYDARLVELGCAEEWAAYETCVLTSVVDPIDCRIDSCSIEWGVYSGCTGL